MVKVPIHSTRRNAPTRRSEKAQYLLKSLEPVDVGNRGLSDLKTDSKFPKPGHREWYNC